jgi:hypothetical protein
MRAGEYGVQLAMETELDITGASEIKLFIRVPGSNVVLERTVAVPGSGTVATYTTTNLDFTTAGIYRLMLRAKWATTKQLKSRLYQFFVEEVLG